jgi:hypothetical protein
MNNLYFKLHKMPVLYMRYYFGIMTEYESLRTIARIKFRAVGQRDL